MFYKISDLIDNKKLQNLLEGFHDVIGMSLTVLDEEGHEIATTNSQGICARFYKQNVDCNRLCAKTHNDFLNRISRTNAYEINKCHLGIGMLGVPIIIENETLAIIVAEDFVFEDIDRKLQETKGRYYGFPTEAFQSAIDGLSVISNERAISMVQFLQSWSQLIGDMAQEKIKAGFLINISHELRTPINVVLGAIQVLSMLLRDHDEKNHKEKIDKYINIMKQNCFRLLRLISNVIDITKIDSGYIQPNMRNMDIAKILEDIIYSVREYVEDKGISFVFYSNIKEKIILCDAEKIERILLNLISNAVKFSERGDKITVLLKAEGEKVIISVRDTGMGIPTEMQDKVFERFVQVNKTIRRSYEGSGIGLSLAKSLVEMHGGNICLHSELGKGSEFIVELPAFQDFLLHESVTENIAGFEATIEKVQIEFSDI